MVWVVVFAGVLCAFIAIAIVIVVLLKGSGGRAAADRQAAARQPGAEERPPQAATPEPQPARGLLDAIGLGKKPPAAEAAKEASKAEVVKAPAAAAKKGLLDRLTDRKSAPAAAKRPSLFGLAVSKARLEVTTEKVWRRLAGAPPGHVPFDASDVPALLKLLKQFVREGAPRDEWAVIPVVCDGLVEAGERSSADEVYRLLAQWPRSGGVESVDRFEAIKIENLVRVLKGLGREDLVSRIIQEARAIVNKWAAGDKRINIPLNCSLRAAGLVGCDDAIRLLSQALRAKGNWWHVHHSVMLEALGLSQNPNAPARIVEYLNNADEQWTKDYEHYLRRARATSLIALARLGTRESLEAFLSFLPQLSEEERKEMERMRAHRATWGDELLRSAAALSVVWELRDRLKGICDVEELLDPKSRVHPPLACLAAALDASDEELRRRAAEKLLGLAYPGPARSSVRKYRHRQAPAAPSPTMNEATRLLRANLHRVSPAIRRGLEARLRQEDTPGIFAWRVHTGQVACACADEDTLYLQGERCGLLALDKRTPKVVWQRDPSQQPPAEKLVLAPGGVLIAVASEDVRAYRARDGKPLWSIGLRRAKPLGVTRHAVVLGGRVLCVVGLDDGELRWASSRRNAICSGEYVLAADQKLVGVGRAQDARPLWLKAVAGRCGREGFSGCGQADAFYLMGSPRAMERLDARSGAVPWRYELPPRSRGRLIGCDDGAAYAWVEGDGDRRYLVALDAKTGQERWRTRFGFASGNAAFDCTGPNVSVTTVERVVVDGGPHRERQQPRVHMVTFSKETGAERQHWEVHDGEPLPAAPGRLLAATPDAVYTYDCAADHMRMAFRPADALIADPSWPAICQAGEYVVAYASGPNAPLPLLGHEALSLVRPVFPASLAKEWAVVDGSHQFARIEPSGRAPHWPGASVCTADGEPLAVLNGQLAGAVFLPPGPKVLKDGSTVMALQGGLYRILTDKVYTKVYTRAEMAKGDCVRVFDLDKKQGLWKREQLWGVPSVAFDYGMNCSHNVAIADDGTVYSLEGGGIKERDAKGQVKREIKLELGDVVLRHMLGAQRQLLLMPNGNFGVFHPHLNRERTGRRRSRRPSRSPDPAGSAMAFVEFTPEGKQVRRLNLQGNWVQVDASGNLYVETHDRGSDARVVKYSPSGDVLASPTVNSGCTLFHAWAVTPNGLLVVRGSQWSCTVYRFEAASSSKLKDAFAQGQWQQALDMLAATKPTDDKETARIEYMNALCEQQRWCAAAADAAFAKAVNSDPQLLEAHYGRAIFLDVQGRLGDAVNEWAAVIAQAGPEADRGEVALERVVTLARWQLQRPKETIAGADWAKVVQVLQTHAPDRGRRLAEDAGMCRAEYRTSADKLVDALRRAFRPRQPGPAPQPARWEGSAAAAIDIDNVPRDKRLFASALGGDGEPPAALEPLAAPAAVVKAAAFGSASAR